MKKRKKSNNNLIEKRMQKDIEIAINCNSFNKIAQIQHNCLRNNIDFTLLITDKNKFKVAFVKTHPKNILPKKDEDITHTYELFEADNIKSENIIESEDLSLKNQFESTDLESNYTLKSEYKVKTINKIDSEQENIFLKNELKSYLDLASIVLSLYREEIDIFLELERKFFHSVLTADYEESLLILEKIENDICFSKWCQFMRLIVLNLISNDDSIENNIYKLTFDGYSDLIEFNSSRLSHLIECNLFSNKLNNLNHLHTDTLLDNFVSLINNWKDDLGKFDGGIIDGFLKEINHGYYEKSIISPFNKISDYKTFSRLINEHIHCSIIDIYKTFSSIIVELQNNNENYFNDYIYGSSNIVKRVIRLSFKDNIIKTNYYKNSAKGLSEFFLLNEELNLIEIYDEFLKGDFDKVITLTLNKLVAYPYSIDLIYFLVHSLSYVNKHPQEILKSISIKENSLVFYISVNYFNLLNNIDMKNSIENLKKLLLMFGSHSQWSMYLYSMISNFLCKNSDIKNRKFSNAILYSYFSHPRIFYSLNDSTQKVFLSKIDNKYESVKRIFNLSINAKDEDLDLYISPKYRAGYINFKNIKNEDNNLYIIQSLYGYKENMPFFYRVKVMTAYILKLVDELNYTLALELIIKNFINYNMPLCVVQYKNPNQEYLFKDCEHLPHFALLCVLDNAKDTVRIYYTVMEYLQSISSQCFKPSHLKNYMSSRIFEQNVQIRLLKEIIKEEYIEEFLLHLGSRIDIYEEQLLILELIQMYDKSYDDDSLIRNIIEDKINILTNTTFIKEQKISIDLRKIKLNLISSFSETYESLLTAPRANEKYLFYNLITNADSYLNQNKNFSKEEKLENIFRNILKEIIYSNIGVVNSISENILHNHLDDTIRQPLLDDHIFLQTNNDKFDDTYWTQNLNISNTLIEFSKNLNKFLEKFKNKIKLFSAKKGTVYFDFSFENIITKDRFINFLTFYEEQLTFDKWTYLTFLDEIINYSLFFIKKEILFGSEKIKKDLVEEIDVLFSPLEEIQNLKFKSHYTHSRDIVYSKSIDAIVSWFKLNETQIYKDFEIKEVIDTIKKEHTLLANVPVECSFSKKIKGEYFLTFHRIYILLLDNVFIHSHAENMKLRINVKEDDHHIIIENTNMYTEDCASIRSNNTGLGFLQKNIEYKNEKNTFCKEDKNNEFKIILNLLKKDLLDE